MHRHRHDYVFVTLGASQVENDVFGKPPATLKLQDGEVHFTPGNFAHVAKNLADAPFRNVTVELLKDEDKFVRDSARFGLEEICRTAKAKEMVPTLVRTLNDEEEDQRVRGVALAVLFSIHPKAASRFVRTHEPEPWWWKQP